MRDLIPGSISGGTVMTLLWLVTMSAHFSGHCLCWRLVSLSCCWSLPSRLSLSRSAWERSRCLFAPQVQLWKWLKWGEAWGWELWMEGRNNPLIIPTQGKRIIPRPPACTPKEPIVWWVILAVVNANRNALMTTLRKKSRGANLELSFHPFIHDESSYVLPSHVLRASGRSLWAVLPQIPSMRSRY